MITASSEAESGLIADFKNWARWSTWDALDPKMKKEFISGGSGVGSAYAWESTHKNVGKG